MISTMTPTPAALLSVPGTAASLCAYPAATAAPKTAVVAVTRSGAQETSALRSLLRPVADVPATGLVADALLLGDARAVAGAPVQGPPSRGTPV